MTITFYRGNEHQAILNIDIIDISVVEAILTIPYVNIAFITPTPVDLGIGDYIIYNDSVYKLYQKPEHKNNNGQYQYQLKLYHTNHEITHKIFLKPNTSETTFKTVGTLEDILKIWLWNVNKDTLYIWEIGETIHTPLREIQFTEINCFDVLIKLCEIFHCEVRITNDKKIYFQVKLESDELIYLDHSNLVDVYQIKNVQNYTDFYTHAYIRGGNINIPLEYQDETQNLKPPFNYLENLEYYQYVKETKKYFKDEYPYYILPIKNKSRVEDNLFLIEVEEEFGDKIQNNTKIKFLTGVLQEREFNFSYNIETNLIEIHFEHFKEDILRQISIGDLITFTNYEIPKKEVEKSIQRLTETSQNWFYNQNYPLVKMEVQFNEPFNNYFDRLSIGSYVSIIHDNQRYQNIRIVKTKHDLITNEINLIITNHPNLLSAEEIHKTESLNNTISINSLSGLKDVSIIDLLDGDILISEDGKWGNQPFETLLPKLIQEVILNYFKNHHDIEDVNGLTQILKNLINVNDSQALDLLNKMFILRDEDTNAPIIEARYDFYSVGGISALGLGDDDESGGDFDRLDKWEDYDSTKAVWVLSALLGKDLDTRTKANLASILALNQRVDSIEVVDSDKNFVHTQGVPSDTWTIAHTLNKYPSVTIIDSGGTEVIGNINYTDTSTITVTFASAFSGKAILN